MNLLVRTPGFRPMSLSERVAGEGRRISLGLPSLLAALIAFCDPVAGQVYQGVERTAAAAETEYRINPGDELDVLVWGEEKMQRAVRVQPDGTFAFPLAGTINAAGLSASEVSAQIRLRLTGKYRDGAPDVTVSVRDASGMRFFVVGKVRTPGSFPAGGTVNILQALSLAGGLAEFADVKGAVILRKTAQGQVVERVRLSAVLRGSHGVDVGALPVALPVLRSGDVLVIP